jgi:hypothetical protein
MPRPTCKTQVNSHSVTSCQMVFFGRSPKEKKQTPNLVSDPLRTGVYQVRVDATRWGVSDGVQSAGVQPSSKWGDWRPQGASHTLLPHFAATFRPGRAPDHSVTGLQPLVEVLFFLTVCRPRDALFLSRVGRCHSHDADLSRERHQYFVESTRLQRRQDGPGGFLACSRLIQTYIAYPGPGPGS